MSVATVAPSAGPGLTIGTVTANQPSAQQFPLFRIPEVSVFSRYFAIL